jgi:hypothetical protein
MGPSNRERLRYALVDVECLLEQAEAGSLVGQAKGNVAEAQEAIGLAKEVAQASEEREGFLIMGVGGVMVVAAESDVAEALDAGGFAEEMADASEKR